LIRNRSPSIDTAVCQARTFEPVAAVTKVSTIAILICCFTVEPFQLFV